MRSIPMLLITAATAIVLGGCAQQDMMKSDASAEAALSTGGNPMVGGAAMYPSRTIVENAVNSADHKTLVAAVKAAGLVDTLNSPGPFTVFAPTDAAFAKLPAGTVEELVKPENKAKLTEILTYHVVATNALSSAINTMIADDGGAHPVATVSGGTLIARQTPAGISLTDELGRVSNVTIADVRQSNGVIHVIDTVLLPASMRTAEPAPMAQDTMAMASTSGNPMVGGAEMFESRTIVENAVNSADHKTLVAAVKAAGLVDTLNGPGPFTVFAPTDAAFAKLPAGTVEELIKPENKAKLTEILTYHVVPTNALSEAISTMVADDGGAHLIRTVSGGVMMARAEGGMISLTDETGRVANVTIADVKQSNGVIHVIDTVMLPAS